MLYNVILETRTNWHALRSKLRRTKKASKMTKISIPASINLLYSIFAHAKKTTLHRPGAGNKNQR